MLRPQRARPSGPDVRDGTMTARCRDAWPARLPDHGAGHGDVTGAAYNRATMPNIAFIARPRLAPGQPAAARRWERAAERTAHLMPEITIALGDLCDPVDPSPGRDGALAWVAECLQDWPTPVRCVPGGADVGAPAGAPPVDVGALLRFRRTIGADRWCQAVGPWRLAGLHLSLLEGATEESTRQWAWLEGLAARLDAHGDGRRLVLCLDRPLGHAPARDGGVARRRLLGGVVGAQLAAVVSAPSPLAPDMADGGAYLEWLDAGPPGRRTPVEQLVLGDRGDEMGWLSLDTTPEAPRIELGVARLDRCPAGGSAVAPLGDVAAAAAAVA